MTTIGYDPAHDDPDDPRWYCQHGQYIGTPGGPDHICGWCEDGITREDMITILRDRELWVAHDLEAKFDRMGLSWREKLPGWSPLLAQFLMDWAERPEHLRAAITLEYLDAA